jgi:hypothetical protein
MAGAIPVSKSQGAPVLIPDMCGQEWDTMGSYGRQWERPVNRWNDLEISRFAQFSVIAKSRFFNNLNNSPQVETQTVAVLTQ